MSSPTELQYSPADFLTKWMPSSARAGVILGPSPELAGSSRHTNAAVPAPLHPDDSFVSDFAPSPASADSSCLGVDGCGEGTGPADYPCRAPRGVSGGRCENLVETAGRAKDLSPMMKLEELRKWQQHMHEQSKAHQSEESSCSQEEQQRLLGAVNVPQICAEERTGLAEQWRKDTVQNSPDGIDAETRGVDGLQQELISGHPQYEADDNGMWDSSEEKHSLKQDDTLMQPETNSRQQDNDFHDRPIKPGIGGQKKTFEELSEEQSRSEEQRLKSGQQQPNPGRPEAAVPPKRPFSKRGEGLSRFINSSKASRQKVKNKKEQKPQPEARAIIRSNSAPGSISKGSSNVVPQSPVQRKTAILNKENRVRGLCSPPQDVRAGNKAPRTRVSGSHQRQNTGPATIQKEPEVRHFKPLSGQEEEYKAPVVRNSGPNLQPNPVTKQVGLSGGPVRDAGKEKSSASEVESVEVKDGQRLPQESFELSFQEKLQRWECNRQSESMESGEFESLEQAAEESSFSSNSSFVMKVLRLDQQKRSAAIGLHRRRLSSTPIKSTLGSEPQKNGGVHLTDGSEGMSSESGASVETIGGDSLQSKVNGETEGGQEAEDKNKISDSGSESGDEEVTIKGTGFFSAPANPTYDKRSYQDEGSLGDSASDGVEVESVGSDADGSTLIEDGGGQPRKVIFDDDDTWNDSDDTAVSKESDCQEVSLIPRMPAARISPPEKVMLRKIAASRVMESDAEAAPASQSMTRLFPSLQPKPQSTSAVPPAASESSKSQDDTAQQVQSRQLRERSAELEIQIERFRKENAALTKLRQENEKRQEESRKECLEFEQRRAEESAKFEEYKKEENRKSQKERRSFEKHASAARAIPDKKEREEIQSLKQQSSSSQEEMRRRESRWASTHSRSRQQIDSLSQENSSSRDEIRTSEKSRLSVWKKSSASAETGVQTNDGPRTSVTSVPSVNKGVTFATPSDSRGSGSSPPLSSTAARRNSKDGAQGAAGMKSSSRRSAGSLSPSLSSGRPIEEKPRAISKSQEKPSNQKWNQSQGCSPKIDSEQAESCEANEAELPQEVITHPDGKVEKVLASGDRLIVFPNGTKKEVSADGLSAKVTFFNGDTKQITADQRVIYYYAEAQTTHITYPDGMEVSHFPNNQTEKHFPDGRKEITFPDQTMKNLFPDGREESVSTDGTIIQVNPDGTKEIHFNTGQKEIHTAEYKRREYPDGTVKTVYTDGRQETRYPTGRLRVKDKDGNVISDNRT